MTRTALLLTLCLAARPALAGDGPVCARSAVVEHLQDVLQQAGRRVAIEPGSIGEFSVGPDRVVHCAARGYVVGYDTARFGMQGIDAPFIVRYSLDLRRNGIFMRLE